MIAMEPKGRSLFCANRWTLEQAANLPRCWHEMYRDSIRSVQTFMIMTVIRFSRDNRILWPIWSEWNGHWLKSNSRFWFALRWWQSAPSMSTIGMLSRSWSLQKLKRRRASLGSANCATAGTNPRTTVSSTYGTRSSTTGTSTSETPPDWSSPRWPIDATSRWPNRCTSWWVALPLDQLARVRFSICSYYYFWISSYWELILLDIFKRNEIEANIKIRLFEEVTVLLLPECNHIREWTIQYIKNQYWSNSKYGHFRPALREFCSSHRFSLMGNISSLELRWLFLIFTQGITPWVIFDLFSVARSSSMKCAILHHFLM